MNGGRDKVKSMFFGVFFKHMARYILNVHEEKKELYLFKYNILLLFLPF